MRNTNIEEIDMNGHDIVTRRAKQGFLLLAVIAAALLLIDHGTHALT